MSTKMTKNYRNFRPLDSDIRLHTAAIDGRVILAFARSELVGTGRIEKITEMAVKLRKGNGESEWFVRGNHTFVYAE